VIKQFYSIMDRLSTIINIVGKFLLAIFLATMCTFTVAQIFFRYVLSSALIWPEELNIFLMVWITFVGSSVAIKEKSHIGVDMFVNLLPQQIAHIIRICSKIVVFYCVVLITKYGFNVAQMNLDVFSDALRISMFIPRISLVVGGLMMLFQIFYLLMLDFKVFVGQEGKI